MKTPRKSIKKYCGGDHCTMLWNLPCSEDHGLPKKSIKKMEKKKLDWVDIECTCGCKTSWRIIGVKQTVRVVMSQIL